MTVRGWTCVASLLVAPAVILAPVSEAFASPSPSVAEREAKAAALFEEGKHAEAVAIFEELYAERGAPNYLYNIARIQEDAANLDAALENYEKFIASPDVELEQRAAASERIRMLRSIAENTRERPAKEPADDEPDNEAGEDDDPQTEGVASSVGSDDDDPDDKNSGGRPSRLRITSYVFMGTGAAVLIAGGVVGGLAVRDQDRLTAEGPVSDSEGLQRDGERKAITADVLFAVGGAVAATGLTMLIVDLVRAKKKREGSTARRGGHFVFAPSGEGVVLGIAGRL